MTVEKPTREKRRRPATVKVEERARGSVQPAPVDADERRRARERAGGDD